MKKLTLQAVSAALAVTLSVGCSRAIIDPEIIVPEDNTVLREMTFTASFENDPSTRTTISPENDTKVLWLPGDEIKLFFCGSEALFTSTCMYEPEAVTNFTGSISTVIGGDENFDQDGYAFHAIYPYQEQVWFDGTCFSDIILKDEQTGAEGTFGDDQFITLARSNNTALAFYNVCSGLRFKVAWGDIREVTLTANMGEPLAGSFTACFDKNTLVPVVFDVFDGTPSVKLVPESGEYFQPDVWYYMVSLPTELNKGFTIQLNGVDAYTYLDPLTFKRGRFCSLSMTPENTYYEGAPTFDLVNNVERQYMQEAQVAYADDLDDYSTSIVRGFIGDYQNHLPNPVTLGSDSWVEVATDPNFSNPVYYQSNTVFNLIPGSVYWWRNSQEQGTFTTVGPLRTIYIDGVDNVRDLGGWKAGKNHIRYGKLFRGGRLDNITHPEDLNALGITADLDLRGNPPGTSGGSGESYPIPWLKYANFPVIMFMASQSGPEGTTSGLYQAAIRQVIQWLRDGETIYFHCHGGADRTGTLAFLIESLLGVSEVDANIDYELTSFASSVPRLRTVTNINQYPFKRLILFLKQFEGETMQEKVTNWAMTPYYGDSNYVGQPLSLEEIQELKDLLLE